MRISDLIFVGIKGSVVALHRTTGDMVWGTRLKGADFVNVVLEGSKLLATCCGEIFCLDALAGKVLWHNPLKGLGRGLATIATERNPGGTGTVSMEAKRRQDEEAAAAGSAAACA